LDVIGGTKWLVGFRSFIYIGFVTELEILSYQKFTSKSHV